MTEGASTQLPKDGKNTRRFLRRPRLWVIALALLVVVALSFRSLLNVPVNHIDQMSFAGIREGMTMQEVEKLFGPPEKVGNGIAWEQLGPTLPPCPGEAQRCHWYGDEVHVELAFDLDGRVIGKVLRRMGRVPRPTLTERIQAILKWLGL